MFDTCTWHTELENDHHAIKIALQLWTYSCIDLMILVLKTHPTQGVNCNWKDVTACWRLCQVAYKEEMAWKRGDIFFSVSKVISAFFKYMYLLNIGYVSNETNTNVRMYNVEFILIEIWIHCCTCRNWDTVWKIHWYLYNCNKGWGMWELLLDDNWQGRNYRITMTWESVTWVN